LRELGRAPVARRHSARHNGKAETNRVGEVLKKGRLTMITALVLIALSGAPPSIEMKTICKDARVSALPEDAQVAYDSCVHDEQAALDKLKAGWTHYSASARSACTGEDSIAPSYVELWTCLEMQPGGSLSLKDGDAGAAPMAKPTKP
jgi:hypothetical protein